MTRVFKWSSNRSSKGFQNMPKQWLSVTSDGNPGLKQWLAITSDSNPFFKRRKTRRQKDGCSLQRVRFIRALNYFIFMHPRSDVRFSASFLEKEEKSSFIAKYFLFYDFSWRYLCKTWWYHENFFRNQRKCFQNIHLSIMTKNTLSKDIHMSIIGVKTQFVFQLVSSHNWS